MNTTLRKCISAVMVMICPLFFSSCYVKAGEKKNNIVAPKSIEEWGGRMEAKKPKCPLSERTIAAEEIYSVSNNSSIPVEIVTGKPAITITAPAEVIDKIKIMNKGGAVSVNIEDGVFLSGCEKVEVSGKEFNNLRVNGSGSIMADALTSSALTLRTDGSGDIKISILNVGSLKAILRGSGDIIIPQIKATTAQMVTGGSGDILITNGEAVSLSGVVQGSGDLKLKQLISGEVNVVVQGSGDADLNGLNVSSINALVQGSGDISLEGNAKRANLLVQGSGDIHARKLQSEKITKSIQGVGDID